MCMCASCAEAECGQPTAAEVQLPPAATIASTAASARIHEQIRFRRMTFRVQDDLFVQAPFDIAIGRCAVVRDPFGNVLVVLDMSKGALHTDAGGNVVDAT